MITRARKSMAPAPAASSAENKTAAMTTRRVTRASGAFGLSSAGMSIKDTNLLVDIAAPLAINFPSPFKPMKTSNSNKVTLIAALATDDETTHSANKENNTAQEEKDTADESADRAWAEMNKQSTPVAKRFTRSQGPVQSPVTLIEELG